MFFKRLILFFYSPIKNILIQNQIHHKTIYNQLDNENKCNLTYHEIDKIEEIQFNFYKKKILVQLKNPNISTITKLNIIDDMNKYKTIKITDLYKSGLYDDYTTYF